MLRQSEAPGRGQGEINEPSYEIQTTASVYITVDPPGRTYIFTIAKVCLVAVKLSSA